MKKKKKKKKKRRRRERTNYEDKKQEIWTLTPGCNDNIFKTYFVPILKC
jgi:hypothetical protein